jgi:hypothetical protein
MSQLLYSLSDCLPLANGGSLCSEDDGTAGTIINMGRRVVMPTRSSQHCSTSAGGYVAEAALYCRNVSKWTAFDG